MFCRLPPLKFCEKVEAKELEVRCEKGTGHNWHLFKWPRNDFPTFFMLFVLDNDFFSILNDSPCYIKK